MFRGSLFTQNTGRTFQTAPILPETMSMFILKQTPSRFQQHSTEGDIMDKILRDKKAIFVFIAPALIMFLLVLIIPTVQMVYYSLCDYAALTPPEFVGLKNYKKLFSVTPHSVLP